MEFSPSSSQWGNFSISQSDILISYSVLQRSFGRSQTANKLFNFSAKKKACDQTEKNASQDLFLKRKKSAKAD